MLSLQGKQRMPSNFPNPTDALFTFGLGSRAMWITQRQQGHFYQLVEKHILPHQHKFCMLLLTIVFNGIFIMFHHTENREHGSYWGDRAKRDANQRISATQSGGRREGKNEAMKINLHHREKGSLFPRQTGHRDPGIQTQRYTSFYFYFLSCKRNVEIEYELGPAVAWALILTEHFP